MNAEAFEKRLNALEEGSGPLIDDLADFSGLCEVVR
jgi:hypothetical protein